MTAKFDRADVVTVQECANGSVGARERAGEVPAVVDAERLAPTGSVEGAEVPNTRLVGVQKRVVIERRRLHGAHDITGIVDVGRQREVSADGAEVIDLVGGRFQR